MESSEQNRRVQKRYLCEKCVKPYSKLVETFEEFTQCPNCDWMGEEISEEKYKSLKNPTTNNQQRNFNQQQNQSNQPFNNRYLFQSLFNDSMFGQFFQSPLANRVNQSHVSESFFMPEFIQFGSTNNNTFRDNFSSNFRSNIMDNSFLLDILQQIQNQQNQGEARPTSSSALNKLKVFKLDKSHCKEEKGKLEVPNCIVCMTDIELGSDTLLIPCGHMFHDKCIRIWLEKHNTCPVCRFELPTS